MRAPGIIPASNETSIDPLYKPNFNYYTRLDFSSRRTAKFVSCLSVSSLHCKKWSRPSKTMVSGKFFNHGFLRPSVCIWFCRWCRRLPTFAIAHMSAVLRFCCRKLGYIFSVCSVAQDSCDCSWADQSGFSQNVAFGLE